LHLPTRGISSMPVAASETPPPSSPTHNYVFPVLQLHNNIWVPAFGKSPPHPCPGNNSSWRQWQPTYRWSNMFAKGTAAGRNRIISRQHWLRIDLNFLNLWSASIDTLINMTPDELLGWPSCVPSFQPLPLMSPYHLATSSVRSSTSLVKQNATASRLHTHDQHFDVATTGRLQVHGQIVDHIATISSCKASRFFGVDKECLSSLVTQIASKIFRIRPLDTNASSQFPQHRIAQRTRLTPNSRANTWSYAWRLHRRTQASPQVRRGAGHLFKHGPTKSRRERRRGRTRRVESHWRLLHSRHHVWRRRHLWSR
jgi:hypothetical protein